LFDDRHDHHVSWRVYHDHDHHVFYHACHDHRGHHDRLFSCGHDRRVHDRHGRQKYFSL